MVSLPDRLTHLLGRDVVVGPHTLAGFAIDGLSPEAVAQPSNRQEIIQLLKWATSELRPVFARGGGTQLALGNRPQKIGLVLDLNRLGDMNIDHRPADLTATMDAGVTLNTLQQELARQGQFLPLEAPLADRATIGGILASNASGPMRSSYGLAREWLLGITVVTASGVEIKAGGKVVKNVTGYDLNKLFVGSLGTLGVIVEATFKLAPLAPRSGVLLAAFPTLPAGITAAGSLLRLVASPAAVHVVNRAVGRRIGVDTPFSDAEALALVFISGRARAVERRLTEVSRQLHDGGATSIEWIDGPLKGKPGRETGTLLQRLTSLGWDGDTVPHLGLKVNLPPSEVGRLAQSVSDLFPGEIGPGIVADMGFGAVQLLWWNPRSPPLAKGESGGTSPTGEAPEMDIISRLRSLVQEWGGSLTVEHCPLPLKGGLDVWGEGPQSIEIMRRIKQQFDPRGILSPGRFVGRI